MYRTCCDAVTCHSLSKLAHCRCTYNSGWLTEQNFGQLWHQHRSLRSKMFWLTDSTLWQSISEFSEHFGVALWFIPVAVPSPLTATSAKPDARGPLFGHFALSEFQSVRKALSEYPKVWNGLMEVLKTPQHPVGVSDLSGTFSDKGHRIFLAEIIEIVKPTGSVSHTLVYTTQNLCHDLL